MSYGYDEEAIYQDADIEQAQLEEAGNRIHDLNKRGVCTHEGWVGRSKTGESIYPEQDVLIGDEVRCTHGCGKLFASEEALLDERAAIIA